MKTPITFLFLLILSCAPPQNFEIPEHQLEVPQPTTQLQAIAERVAQSPSGFVHFGLEEEDLWVAAYVSSSDAGGNFYKELYVQDQAENPQLGVRLLLDQTSLYTAYPPGQKVLIRLNGLGAGKEQGILSLGTYEADGVGVLPKAQIEHQLFRTEEQLPILPKSIRMGAIHPNHIGLWVAFEQVQFAQSEVGKSFSGEAFDEFDGERQLLACSDYYSLFLSSSTFAKFKSLELPSLSGRVQGILTRDFYNDKNILKINSTADIDFQDNRCDPPFGESFETAPLGKWEGAGWFNSIEKGSVYWQVMEDENTLGQSLTIGSYRSGDSSSVCWLILPPFDLLGYSQPQFQFRSSSQFGDKAELEVLYSSDFMGDSQRLDKATWKPLNATIATPGTDDLRWVESGRISLKSLGPKIHIAFRYTGSGKAASDGTFKLDDFYFFDLQ